jgi:flagellar FliL protein
MADAKAAKKDDKKDDKDPKDPKAEGAAEGAAEGGEADPAVAKKKKIKKIAIFAVIPIVLLLGGGAAAYFMGFIGGHKAEGDLQCENVKEGDEHYAACAEELAKAVTGSTPGVFISVPDITVNLNASGRQQRFLKIELKVELEKPEQQAAFETIMPRVIDQFQTYLRELRVEDLRGSSGIYRMKLELLNRVRAAAPDIGVKDVLFQEILIQ